MKCVFRVDASRLIGAGHVMRCLALAELLREQGADVLFISRRHEGDLSDVVETRGFQLRHLLAPSPDFSPEAMPAHACWVGADWQQDATETGAAIRDSGVRTDWLVVDHYGIDARWEKAVSPAVGGILCIDDLADRPHHGNLLLDQNLVENAETRYTGKLAENCVALLGLEYALLRQDYARLHGEARVRTGPIRRILISFGGADRAQLSLLALRAFLDLRRPDLEADVVLGSEGETATAVRAASDGHANVRVHINVPSLAPLMLQADLAIGAAGSTSWERLCLGLPALVITMAENQQPLAEALQKRELVQWLGHQGEVSLQQVQAALATAVGLGADEHASRRAMTFVDGKGAERVSAILRFGLNSPLRVRDVVAGDEDLLLGWANDPTTRRHSFSTASITAQDHHRWLTAKLNDSEHSRMFIVETEEHVPVGQVRFDREAGGWKVSYSVAAAFRGRGAGRRTLELALDRLQSQEAKPGVFGRVAAENVSSHKVFLGLGFEPVQLSDGVVEYRMGGGFGA